MRKWKAECVRIVAADRSLSGRAAYDRASVAWDAALLAEVRAAVAQGAVGQTGMEEQKSAELPILSPALPTIEIFNAIGDTVRFPPHQYADFVIHCGETDFYVHRFVLHYHSDFFRAHLDTVSRATHLPCRSSRQAKACNHPSIAHCIHLPRYTTPVPTRSITANDFRMFVCHLYFGSHYCYPPFLPKTDVDLEAASLPVSLSFFPLLRCKWDGCPTTATPTSLWSVWEQQLRHDAPDKPNSLHYSHAVLALTQHLDCALLREQCEAVLVEYVQYYEKKGNRDRLVDKCLRGLLVAHRQRLEKIKSAYLAIIAADKELLERKEYQRVVQHCDKALLVQIIESVGKVRQHVVYKNRSSSILVIVYVQHS